MTVYNVNEGGKVRIPVAGGSLSSTVNEINNTRPFTNTPLAETLWTVTGYFAKQTSLLGGPGPPGTAPATTASATAWTR